jgi:predicted HAD superfamily Cof-like phosphohydrolase
MIHSIKEWFKAAKPNPSIADACVQIGCHYEEVSEMSATLYDDVRYALEATASTYKTNQSNYIGVLEELSADARVELLDALCDQIVTAVGVAYMMGMDIEGALAEVNRSNWSKFEGGVPVFNEQGKIAKGVEYTPPELSDYI